MTWEGNPSEEAHENLHDCDREFLEVCFAEIKAARNRGNGHWEFNSQRYHSEYLPLAKTLVNETLANAIWDFATKLKETDNGGFNAYMCPFHCHKVSMKRDEHSHEQSLAYDAREVAELYQQPEFERDV